MNLKQSVLAAAFVCLSASANAATFTLWPSEEGATQIPFDFNHWWNLTVEDVDGAIKCTPTDPTSDAASSGWITYEDWVFDFAQLAPLDLSFDAKIEGSGQWNVRLTAADGVESDVTVAVPADGEYHKVRINVQEQYPAVYSKWLSGGANGKTVFTFSMVGSELSANSAIYVANCKYVDAIVRPTLSADATDVTSTSAKLNINASFPEGYTNTRVTVNGETVTGTELLLENLTPTTEYEYVVVAEGEFEGETVTVYSTVSFRTLRNYDKEAFVWYGSTDIAGFYADYSIAYNWQRKTLTVSAEIVSDQETPAGDRNFHIYIGGDEWLKLYDDGSGVLTGTTVSTFEEGAEITWEWYIPYPGGVYQEANKYIVGAENEAPLAVRVSATAQNVNSTGAEISYTVTAPGSDYKVYYRATDGEAIEATSNPIVLTGLAERTEYSYEVYAVYGQGEKAITSKAVTVSFKTTAEGAVDLVYSDIYPAEFKNAFLIGEDESMRRTIFASLAWEVVYKADGTAYYSVDLSAVENVVGLVAQIYWNGFQTLTKNVESGRYEYNFGAQELDATTAISHYFAYSGGVVDVRTPYTNWGMEKEAPSLGEIASLTLTASAEAAKIGDTIILSAVAKDENGNILNADDLRFNSNESSDIFNGNKVTMAGDKGERILTATCGDFSASVTVLVIATENAANVAEGLKGYTDDNIQAGTVENVTDSDRNSQLEWACGDTEEHYFILDLGEGAEGEGYYVEAVEVYFEGAFATEFTVTLSSDIPAEITEIAASNVNLRRSAATNDVVFSNTTTGTQHYFTQDPDGSHRYVALRTSKALNTGWGIKLRDLKVYATEHSVPTGMTDITVDSDAKVEYFDLNGRSIANPATGIYIRRQGNIVTKVYIK
ncbi:MAG: fibronectin type III domain-containing protein [Muribaculaceae bacterium]|nr:fibronectin type III domain-containing protein [Muribaculaceae bacterium]